MTLGTNKPAPHVSNWDFDTPSTFISDIPSQSLESSQHECHELTSRHERSTLPLPPYGRHAHSRFRDMDEQFNRAFGGEFQPGLYPYKDRKQPNPAPLGLCGMAMCNFLLALVNMGTEGLSSPALLISVGFVYGGLIQILAGMWEMAVGNTFGATALASYGAYWISYAIIHTPGGFHIMDMLQQQEGVGGAMKMLGLYELGWFVFTTLMTLMTTKSTVVFFSLFVALDLTYLFAGLSFLFNDGTGPNKTLLRCDGAFGIITSFLAWYNAYSGIADETNSFFTTPVLHFPWSAEAPLST
ncbi:Meiotically up-regulated protein 86 protein [Malassezia nana]|uniref:Meiotically up-regulated protein 86 protein n=1 Tax=Malassezia nana TaxID=180528 RepID=A0AAF0ETY8_9BASI|nr:Meiotically up-regulated protein 86 protein [Malassezia nana]